MAPIRTAASIKQSTMHKMKAPLLLAVVLTLAACSGSDDPAQENEQATASSTKTSQAIRVQTKLVASEPFEEIIELTGTVEALDDAVLSARTSGTVVSLVPLGKSISAGYLAARLDAGLSDAGLLQAQAQLESAEANYLLAEDVFKRQEPLYSDSIISALEFEQVRTQLNQARAQLNQAKGMVAQAEEQLAYSTVVAPFSGTIEEHFVEKGEQVSPGTPMVRIVNSRRLKIAAGVPERFAGDIELGSKARVSFSSYGMTPIDATVSFVGKAIRSDSRTFPIEIEIANTDGKLKPEMIANVHLVRNHFDEAIVVPQSAIVRDETGVSVFIVDRSGANPVAAKRDIVSGPSFGGKVVIESGLDINDELIVAGMNDVSPGDMVQPTNESQTIAQDAK